FGNPMPLKICQSSARRPSCFEAGSLAVCNRLSGGGVLLQISQLHSRMSCVPGHVVPAQLRAVVAVPSARPAQPKRLIQRPAVRHGSTVLLSVRTRADARDLTEREDS